MRGNHVEGVRRRKQVGVDVSESMRESMGDDGFIGECGCGGIVAGCRCGCECMCVCVHVSSCRCGCEWRKSN